MVVNSDLMVPIAALEHFQYCPRQCALIHVDHMWHDNAHTIRGQHGHRRVDSGQTSPTRGVTTLRAIPLWSERLGLTGRADAVEIHPDGVIVPVEYKIGRLHNDSADLQLCAQALCLEEMSRTQISHGFLWLSAHRRRHRVVFDPEIRQRTEACIRQVRDLMARAALPAAPDDQRCEQCQFLDFCLPHLVAHPSGVREYEATVVLSCES